MCSKVEKYSEDEVDSKDVKWIEWKESVDHFVAKKQRMERTPCPDNSHIRVFPNQREDPLLPKGFTWGRQKQLYCPPDLLCHNLVNTDKPTLDHEFGYVFCHRALYDRAQGIVDNSAAAIENGVNHGYYLHELDSFVFDRLDKTIVVHEKGAFRVSAEDKQWKEMTIFEILKMFLVDRKVDLSKLDFTESFEKTDQTVPDLLSTFWKELLHPTGVTLQIDMRDDDFKKLFSYYSYHIFQGTSHRKSLGSHLFRPTMFKGYNHHFKSFDALRDAIEQECITAYGRNYFETEHLHWFPHLMMVIAAEAVMELLKEEYPSYSLPQKGPPFDFSTTPSYEQIYVLAMRHISSFVDIGKNHYNFILEVEYSGLGLGYDVKNDLAWNPLNGERIVTEEVIFEARFDRALIDVTLELKRAHKGLLIASCTRLPDVILPTGNYIAGYLTSKMKPWETEEKGISRHLRTIHGGLYPQSDICIADNAGGEIAARTWIDQYANLNREDLLKLCYGGYSYQDWLESSRKPDLVEAMSVINGDFLANRVGGAAPVAPEQDVSTAGPIPLDEADNSLNDWQEILNSPNEDRDEPKREFQAKLGSIQDFDPRVAITDPMGRMHICEVGPNDKRRILHVGDRDFVFDNVQNAIRASSSLYVYYAIDAGYHRHMNDYGEIEQAGKFPVRNYEAIKRLIKSGADVNVLTGIYGTPLALACVKGDYNAVKFLLESGAKASVKGPFGYPLELASAKGHVEVVRLLLKQINPHDSFYASAFQTACLEGESDIVKVFIEKHGLSRELLEGACAQGYKQIVLYLLSKGATIKLNLTNPRLYMLQQLAGSRGLRWPLHAPEATNPSSIYCFSEGPRSTSSRVVAQALYIGHLSAVTYQLSGYYCGEEP
ncbi:hypothetical protein GGP41_007338 [Bipolaris sorokiniana]|uniref:Ankyrin repeat protein n=1 Tax=Cochliobolus sativus TaxID=45130 RepID=A0A8H5ZST6_COCSA|nr:hypothetical protein GGP41_007338 [Bipolaris sorokiniana]